MKIVSLQAENFKRLKAVEIDAEGKSLVIVAGRNAQGKSSVLDAIWSALSNAAASKETTRPIRDGEKKASVTLTLDDLVVTRKWGSGAGLTVTARDGKAKFNSPQKLLDELIGKLSFDPLAFAHMDDKAQRQTLIDLADIAERIEELEADRKQAYEERTEVNREVKRVRANLDSLGPAPAEPLKEIDTAALVQEMRTSDRRRDLLEEHKRIGQQIAELQVRQAQIVEEGKALPKTRPSEELYPLIDGAGEHNKKVQQQVDREHLSQALEQGEYLSSNLTVRIEDNEDAKQAALADARLPVDGLSFDDEGVLYNGVPFKQASDAERLRVSVAMAMALNPKLRVIRLKDGSLLDSTNMALIQQMAADHDFQVWIERVDESGEVGVVIEDGEVKA